MLLNWKRWWYLKEDECVVPWLQYCTKTSESFSSIWKLLNSAGWPIVHSSCDDEKICSVEKQESQAKPRDTAVSFQERQHCAPNEGDEEKEFSQVSSIEKNNTNARNCGDFCQKWKWSAIVHVMRHRHTINYSIIKRWVSPIHIWRTPLWYSQETLRM